MQGTFTIGGVTFDKRLTTAIILTTLLALFDYYGRDLLANDAYNRFVVYFLCHFSSLCLFSAINRHTTDCASADGVRGCSGSSLFAPSWP